jgi:putative peptide modification system cyclase
MKSNVTPLNRSRVGGVVTPLLRAVLFADLVDSTAFIQRFGDARAAVALRRFDLQIRDLLDFTGGRLIDKADGLLAIFERPIFALDFALRYQQALRLFSTGEGLTLTARVGIHVGEVMTWSNSDKAVAAGAKPLEVEGLAKPVAARLMSLALPGQILLSGMAQTLAQRAQAELGERAERVRWAEHGRYRFKGVPTPLVVHEAGQLGFAPMRPPPSGTKAWRELPIWRRPPVLAAELLLLLVLGGLYVYSALHSTPALAFNARDWVVIGDINNFTADPRLEDSLKSAMRIGLEQSRYVNIVPELKVRSALERMGRGGQTSIDRATGSEIALREGARVLLLPTVAEVGGNLRFSIEVIDPNTQVTVYSHSAEGRGAETLLASMDAVSVRLREKLGEAVVDVKASDKPLPRVTTGNLDALRAYTLAQRRVAEARFDEAVALNEEAIRLDPDFAMAYVALARLRQNYGDDDGYYSLMAKAESLRSRLTHREQLLLDGSISTFAPIAQSLAKWRLLTDMYPDEFSGYYNYALTSWYHSYDLAKALLFLRPALDSRNPRRRSAFYLQGVLLLCQERYAEALASFQQYESLGGQGYDQQHAEAFAVQRRFAEAQRAYDSRAALNVANVDFASRIDSVIFPLDQGQWRVGMSVMDEMMLASAKINPETEHRTSLTWISLRSFAPDPKLAQDIRRHLDSGGAEPKAADLVGRISLAFNVLSAGLFATENGDAESGRRALKAAAAQAAAAGYPSMDNAVAMLEAALLTHDGHPAQAIARLQPLHNGNELYLSHAVLMRAYAAAKRYQDAAKEADWLAAHRGLAYAEFNIDEPLNAANVVQSDLALLSSAEYLLAAGQGEQARKRLASFLKVWPKAGELDFLRDRLARLEKGLGGAAS